MLSNEMKYNFLIKYDKIASIVAPGYDDREISYILNVGQDRVFFQLYNPLANKYQQGFEMSEKRRRELDELIRQVTLFGNVKTNTTLYFFSLVTGTTNIYDLVGKSTTKGLAEGVSLFNPSLTLDNSLRLSSIYVTAILSDTRIRTNKPIPNWTDNLSNSAFISGLGLSASQSEIHTVSAKYLKGFMYDLPPGFLYNIEEAGITNESPGEYVPVKAVTHDYIRGNHRNPYKKPYKNLLWRIEFSKTIHGLGNEDGTTINGVEQYPSSNKRVEIITDSNSIVEYYLRYLKMPRRIICDEVNPENQVNCELDESIHDMILDEAAKHAVSITNMESYQVKVNEKSTSE